MPTAYRATGALNKDPLEVPVDICSPKGRGRYVVGWHTWSAAMHVVDDEGHLLGKDHGTEDQP